MTFFCLILWFFIGNLCHPKAHSYIKLTNQSEIIILNNNENCDFFFLYLCFLYRKLAVIHSYIKLTNQFYPLIIVILNNNDKCDFFSLFLCFCVHSFCQVKILFSTMLLSIMHVGHVDCKISIFVDVM